jgi:hypothetical protein
MSQLAARCADGKATTRTATQGKSRNAATEKSSTTQRRGPQVLGRVSNPAVLPSAEKVPPSSRDSIEPFNEPMCRAISRNARD